jgi:hypothetical protein
MKSKIIIFCLLVFVGCGKPKIFVLQGPANDRYYLSDSIAIVFRKGYIDKAPLISIDGVPFEYQKKLDTIILPINKSQITSISFLNKKNSPIIYGANEDNGAIVINTVALTKNISDTIRFEKKK